MSYDVTYYMTVTRLDHDPNELEHTYETWTAVSGELVGVGTTKASALRDLASRMDVREAVEAAPEEGR